MPAISKMEARRCPPRSRRKDYMSTAAKSPDAEPIHEHLVRRTIEACALAKKAARAAADGIATGSAALPRSLRQRARELDTIDMQISSGGTTSVHKDHP